MHHFLKRYFGSDTDQMIFTAADDSNSSALESKYWWPFWMSENHFRSHFYPFHIDTQLFFFFEIFDKMADVGHFGCQNFTIDRISGHNFFGVFY